MNSFMTTSLAMDTMTTLSVTAKALSNWLKVLLLVLLKTSHVNKLPMKPSSPIEITIQNVELSKTFKNNSFSDVKFPKHFASVKFRVDLSIGNFCTLSQMMGTTIRLGRLTDTNMRVTRPIKIFIVSRLCFKAFSRSTGLLPWLSGESLTDL